MGGMKGGKKNRQSKLIFREHIDCENTEELHEYPFFFFFFTLMGLVNYSN